MLSITEPRSKSSNCADTEHVRWLDSLRALAILGVIAVHSFGDAPDGLVRSFAIRGSYGVQLFFLASAYTLAKLYTGRLGNIDQVFVFWVRRFFRIWPMYFLGILIYGAAYSWHDWIFNALLLHGFSPSAFTNVVPGGWSIAVEWQFYIIFPLMLLAYRRLGTALVFFGFAMLFSSYAFYGYTDPLLKWLFRIPPDLMKAIGAMSTIWFPRNLVFFAGGALLFRLFEAGLILGFDANTRSVIGKTGWVILAVICWISVPEMQPDPIVPFYRHALVCLFFMALFVFVAIGQPFLIVNSLVCKLGTLSYSIYILHFSGLRIAHWLIDQYFGMTSSSSFRCPAIFVVTIVVTWLAAEVTWRLVEKPGIWIGRWVSKTLLPSRCFVSIFKRAEVENPVKI